MNGKSAILIPEELAGKVGENSDFEFFEISGGIWVLIDRKKLGGLVERLKPVIERYEKEVEKKKEVLNDEELAVLRKLERYRFVERIPEIVDKSLTQREAEVLASLIKKGFVTVFKSKKYKKGVYNIADDIFTAARKKTAMEKKKSGCEERKTEQCKDPLERNGYLIVEKEEEAKEISKKLEERIRNGEIRGVRGFDKKFYVVMSDFLAKMRVEINRVLKEKPSTVEEIASKVGTANEAVRAILEIMREEGEVVEKKKGMYALVE